MASGDTLAAWNAQGNLAPAWAFVAFTSGSTEPSLGDTIWGDTSDENGILEFLSLESGAWSGTAAGYMLLSNLSGVVGDWTSGEDFTEGSSTPANHGTLTALPVDCFATPDRRNDKPVLDFDAIANEVAMFQGEMPNHYAGGGITLTGRVAATSATTGDFSFKAFLMSITGGADNIATKNFAAPQANQAIDVGGTAGIPVDFDIAFTDGAQMDSIAKNEMFYLLVMRDAQDGTNDDAAGDAELVSVKIKET